MLLSSWPTKHTIISVSAFPPFQQQQQQQETDFTDAQEEARVSTLFPTSDD